MITSAVERLNLMREGASAFHAGLDTSECPYALVGGTPEDSERAAIWLRGFVYARRDAGEGIV